MSRYFDSRVVATPRVLRRLPIRADYVGKNIPTSRADDVQVRLEETDGEDSVRVESLREAEVPR